MEICFLLPRRINNGRAAFVRPPCLYFIDVFVCADFGRLRWYGDGDLYRQSIRRSVSSRARIFLWPRKKPKKRFLRSAGRERERSGPKCASCYKLFYRLYVTIIEGPRPEKRELIEEQPSDENDIGPCVCGGFEEEIAGASPSIEKQVNQRPAIGIGQSSVQYPTAATVTNVCRCCRRCRCCRSFPFHSARGRNEAEKKEAEKKLEAAPNRRK